MPVVTEYNNTNAVKLKTKAKTYKAFQDAVNHGAKIAAELAPVDTGDLKASADHVTTLKTSGIVAEFSTETNPEYNIYQEYGTGIYAGDADARFPDQEKSRGSRAKQIPWVYFKNGRFYTTYGNKPQPFMRPAYEVVKPELEADLRDVIE